jgi:iron complex outermembrane recepter protein
MHPSSTLNPQDLASSRRSWLASIAALASAAVGFAQNAIEPNPATQSTLGAGTQESYGSISGRVQNVVSGQYLNNARVSVKGSDLVVFTDQSGMFLLPKVPAGTVTLEVFYTGLDPQQIQLEIQASQAIERNIELTSVARYGPADGTIRLASYVVSSSRETDGEAIATNEQRFAPNIKNVVTGDSFGDVVEGNVGEFLKFLPGIAVNYENAQVNTISVRGLSDAMTSVTSDGMPVANANIGNSRAFEFKQVSMNNIARIELTKVPTPATPADSLAGSVNMISKSAFERKTAEFRYRLLLSINHENVDFEKTPDSAMDRKMHRVLPGFDFHYSVPLSDRFGLVISASSLSQYNEQHQSVTNYNAGGTGTGATPAAAYLQNYSVVDAPRFTERNSLSIKADWKVSRYSVLSASGQVGIYEPRVGNLTWAFNAGTIGTPSVAGGRSLTYGPDWVEGATGRGGVTMSGSQSAGAVRISNSANLKYRFDNGLWQLESGLSLSTSRHWNRNITHGTFSTLSVSLMEPVRLGFAGVRRDFRPVTIQAFDNNNREVDLYNIDNYQLTGASGGRTSIDDEFTAGYLNVRRQINAFRFPLAIQIGMADRVQERERQSTTLNWTYGGIDGNAATRESPRPYVMQVYVNQNPGYGFTQPPPWVSGSRAWSAFVANPILFSKTPAQLVSDESSRINGSLFLEEQVSAYYAQAEVRLLNNRLNVLTGVRFEKTTTEGMGPLNDPSAAFVRNADGTFARNAAGQRIRKPEAGAAGSMENLLITLKERGYRAERSYDGYYPSIHFTYNVQENFLARAAYARTYGRPDLVEIIPNTVVNEFDLDEGDLADPEAVRGTLTVRNTGLRPWTADNFDLSLEYYTESGGVFSAGVFLKEIKNFFGDRVWIANAADIEELGLDPRYAGWTITTKFNSGDARISGAEFSMRQSLGQFGRWGQNWTAFLNGTKLKLEGDQQAAFTGFVPENLNWGFNYRRKALMFMAKWNYRGENKGAAFPTLGPDAFNYEKARTTLDMNVEYEIRRWAALFVTVSNVFNVAPTSLRYGSETPGYARQFRTQEYGIQFNVGVKGSF